MPKLKILIDICKWWVWHIYPSALGGDVIIQGPPPMGNYPGGPLVTFTLPRVAGPRRATFNVGSGLRQGVVMVVFTIVMGVEELAFGQGLDELAALPEG